MILSYSLTVYTISISNLDVKGLENFSANFVLVEVDQIIKISHKMGETSKTGQAVVDIVFRNDFDSVFPTFDLNRCQGNLVLLTSVLSSFDGKLDKFGVQLAFSNSRFVILTPTLKKDWYCHLKFFFHIWAF